MKVKLGIMSSVWSGESDFVDAAVIRLRLQTMTSAPIAIYEPEGATSNFCFNNGAEEYAKQLDEYFAEKKNQEAVRKTSLTKEN